MRRVLATSALLATFAACATGPATPTRVTLDRDMLTVRMSDGATCRGPAPAEGAATGWSGRLGGCPWTYAYRVEIDPGTNPLRWILEEVLGEGVLSPIATVTITEPSGRQRVFETPDLPGT